MRKLALMIFAIAVAGVADTILSSANAQESPSVPWIDIDFEWNEGSGCPDSVTPAFILANVPQGTKFLKFIFRNLDRSNAPTAGETILYNGENIIPKGRLSPETFKHWTNDPYPGPCSRAASFYRWTVTAHGESTNNILGSGHSDRMFPESNKRPLKTFTERKEASAQGSSTAISPLAMKLSFEWGDTGACRETKIPAFMLENVPANTKVLHFKMIDIDFPNANHGAGVKIQYTGQKDIPAGAAAPDEYYYRGPCPRGQNTYRWTVTAIGDSDNALGRASAEKKFPVR
jgi:hypothetical protein